MSWAERRRYWRKRWRRLAVVRSLRLGLRDAFLLSFWAICARLSPTRASRLGAACSRVLGRLSTKNDKIRQNLRIVFPQAGRGELDRIEQAIWSNMGAVIGEYPHLGVLGRSAGDGVGLESAIPPHLEPNFSGERLTVFVAGHLANWEVLAVAPAHWGVDLAVIYTPIGEGAADRRLREYRERMSARLLPRDGSARELLRHLRSGRPVGIVADHRADEGASLPFFGATKRTTLSPARLALRTGAELVAVRVERLGPAHFRLSAEGPIRPPAGVGDEETKAVAMMTAFNACLERWIRERPGEWLCSKRAFPKEVVDSLPSRPLGGSLKPDISQHA
ncbi:MAG: lysophospholipid acyltransferase family protein [Geminicoccaceae bacterium]|jgi:KDO2-lipid IV(A) lauroyltransferase|nr:lysophospholipid acyltransferase family protein [Geminicoccaceae bacterium]MCB9966580.1 lysophospholipid acyltransferase family protein [Geminicoccaceae bacterium]HRY22794.1 lysophospholipid acyltransferase family protein [Geminicoccaceae bacterium]